MKNFNTMTNAEINKRLDELAEILESYIDPEPWREYYAEYEELDAILNKRYREANQNKFDAFYKKYIEGKTWEEIDPYTLQTYSDWHKDMYGFRPKSI